LDAQWLGVPQARQRTIFIGVRDDLNIDPAHPKPLQYQYSVRDVLPWIIDARQTSVFNGPDRVFTDRPCATVTTTGIGAKSAALAMVEAKLKTDTERRKFSISELKRICSFPDDYILTGTYAQQWERMGRAVPPIMMSHIAATVRDEILARIPR
jgi:DNA (cytosine-5)-methyltransferase 1